MQRFLTAAVVVAITAGVLRAADIPEFPKPVKEHEWLQQFVGEWEMESECSMPGMPAVKGTMSESVKPLGGFWILSQGKADMGGMKFDCVMTIGYSPAKKKYIGTWTDSMTDHLWNYEGSVDATGKILTLEASGPCPMKPGTTCKFRDVTEFKGKDERVFSSSMQDEKGEWVKMATGIAKRKKA